MIRSHVRNVLPLFALLLLVVPGCAPESDEAQAPSPDVDDVHPLGAAAGGAPHGRSPGTWIVSLRASAGDPHAHAEKAVRKGGHVRHVFAHGLAGFAAELPAAVVEELRADPNVATVEEDAEVPADTVQSSPGWGLDRIDQAQGLNGSFRYDYEGAGTHIYIVDSGVRGDHVEFTGRIGNGVNTYDSSSPTSTATYDHGTAVASVAAGTTKGLARKATIHPVKVGIASSYYVSDIVAGLDWISANAVKPAVVNSSHGGGNSIAMATAYATLLQKGIVVVRSAGNDSTDACWDYPNRVAGAIIVAATTNADGLGWFSNYGPCVTLAAPGVEVLVATNTSATATKVANGTSFSAPYVAGMAAVMLGRELGATPAKIKANLQIGAWSGKVQALPSETPNLLLNSTVSKFLPGAADIDSGEADSTAETYRWSTEPILENDTYKWERSINGGSWQTISTTRYGWVTVQPASKYTMKLRLTQTVTPLSTPYPQVKTFDVSVAPPPVDFCNWKICN